MSTLMALKTDLSGGKCFLKWRFVLLMTRQNPNQTSTSGKSRLFFDSYSQGLLYTMQISELTIKSKLKWH